MMASLERHLRVLQPGRLVSFPVVLLEVLGTYPWLIWISTWQALNWSRPPLSLGSAILLTMAGEVLTRFALGQNWSLSRIRLVVLTAMVVLLTLVIRLDQGGGYSVWDPDWSQYALGHISTLAGGLAFGVYLIWRGLSAGRKELPLDDLYRKFVVGLMALVLLLVLWGTTSSSAAFRRVMSTAGLYVMAYFAVGLLAMALVNMRRRQEPSGTFHRQWLSIVVGLVLGIVAASMAFASLFSFDSEAPLLHPLGTLADWLQIAFLYVVGYPLGLLAAAMVYVLRFLVHLLGRGQPPPSIQPPDFSFLRRSAEEQQARGIPPEAVLALKWGLLALLAFLVLFLLARTLFRYWKGKPEEGIEEVSESLWSLEAFRNDLRSVLAWLFRWLRRRKPTPAALASPPAAVVEGDLPPRLFTVRELYQGLLWQGRRAGLPRRPAETPYEYRGNLEACVGAGSPQVEAITEAYVIERYGDVTVTRERLIQLNHFWRQLRSMLRNEKARAAQ